MIINIIRVPTMKEKYVGKSWNFFSRITDKIISRPTALAFGLSTYKFDIFETAVGTSQNLACADRYSHLKKIIKITHPTPGGFSGLLDVVRSCHGSAGREAGRTARPRMTDRPRTTDHGCHICLRKRYPPHPRVV